MADNKLKARRRTFTLVGKVKLPTDGIDTPEYNQKGTWYGIRTSFGVETGEGNVVHVTLQGGRSTANGFLYVFSKDGKSLKVPIADRAKEEVLSKVSDLSFLKVRLGQDKGYKTIDMIDYVDFLRNNLEDGMEVVVKGTVEYSESVNNGETRVYRNLMVNNIFANVKVEDGYKYPPRAELTQSYIITDTSLPKGFAKELEKEGKTTVSVLVPQYLSSVKNKKGEYVDYKHTVGLPQSIVFYVNPKDEEKLEKAKRMIEGLFKVKRNQVIERDLIVGIREGYEKIEGEITISKEAQALIDEGIMTEEDMLMAPTISSTRVSELVFKKLQLIKNESTGEAVPKLENYTMESLIRPVVDDEEEDQWSFEEGEDSDWIDTLDIEDELPF
ncbi:TPA: hypothetical protein ACGO1T_001593 [Streptococcus suis]